ncbi:unnamed protein product [Nesidiocoris tenuis]|uniref:Uncharacterized protein n=1 Tax=Nesidiocoris tenuis TaxID=355587 RepID=A0A6H5GJB0_9HEMI|nr:unnamed protein product [Nesidiocoris tenuis]
MRSVYEYETFSGECKALVSCMRCDGNNTSHCSRCSQLVLRNRHCREESAVCPPGYVTRWSSLVEFMSAACQGSETSERDLMEYMREIRQLRPEAPLFLEMLNETRRQVRNLPSYSALQPYRPVLKDLSRILILLNRPENKLNCPPSRLGDSVQLGSSHFSSIQETSRQRGIFGIIE